MAFHKCQRWWRNGFADCPYLPLTEHGKTEEDDEDEDDEEELDKLVVPDKQPKVDTPVPVEHENFTADDEFEPQFVPPARGEKEEQNEAVRVAVQEQMAVVMEEALAAVPAGDYFGQWQAVVPAVVPGLAVAPVIAPVLEGAFNASAAPTPAGVVEAAVAAVAGFVITPAIAGAAASFYLATLPPVVAVGLQEVSQAITGAPAEDYFGVNPVAPVSEPEQFLIPMEVIMVAAITATAAVAGAGAGGLFWNWAEELEQLMGGF